MKDEIKKASAKASVGGGGGAGNLYIQALEQISEHLQAIQEFGVIVKDLDLGLCDFPCQMNGRIVYLCWKHGESEIQWWHDTHSGFAGRQPIEPDRSDMIFVILGFDGPEGAAERKIHRPAHLAKLDVLATQNRVILAGPLTDGAGSLIVISAESLAEAEALARERPVHGEWRL